MTNNHEIAVIGLACEFPGAHSPEELWQTVIHRRSWFRDIPPERLAGEYIADAQINDAQGHGDRTRIKRAAVMEGYVFPKDRHLLGESDISSADFSHWLALDCAERAVADSGLNGAMPLSSTRVIVGNTLNGETSRANLLRLRWPYVRKTLEEGGCLGSEADWRKREDFFKARLSTVNGSTLAGALSNVIAGRITRHLDIRGGCYCVDAACASSLVAVAQACSQLATGEIDCCIVGAVDVSLDPLELVGFSIAGALATGDMHVFDKRRTGFLPGEGCGFAVLMRRADAETLNCSTYGVIKGWACSSDGRHDLTSPSMHGQRQVLEQTYCKAGYDIGSVALFEAHGTGTIIGDEINPHFPALRSDSMALSGASRRKQTPSSSSGASRRKQTPSSDRGRAMLSWIDSLAPSDFEAAVARFRGLGLTDARMGEYAMLLTAWAEVDPMAALAYTTENTRGGMVTGTVLAAWASRDPEAAIAWAEAKHEGDEANPYMIGIIRSLAAADPTRATALLQGMPFSAERGEALRAMLPHLMKQGPEAAKSWIAGLADERLRDGATARFAEELAKTDPAGTASWLLANLGEASTRSVDEVFAEWAKTDKNAAMSSFQQLPEGAARSRALRGLVTVEARENPQAAAALMNRHPADVDDRMVYHFVWNAFDKAPDVAASQIALIEDERGRNRMYERSLGAWLDRDANAAQSWINSANLPEPVIRSLANRNQP